VANATTLLVYSSHHLTHSITKSIFALTNMMATATTGRIDLMFRAFSDRTRLRILNLLRAGELCVCDLVQVIGVPQPKISRHLAYLRRAGLVTARKDGLWMYYELASSKNAFHLKLLECLTCCLPDLPELARDIKRLGRDPNRGQCCE
jgi:ArsR family transcriptional regulator